MGYSAVLPLQRLSSSVTPQMFTLLLERVLEIEHRDAFTRRAAFETQAAFERAQAGLAEWFSVRDALCEVADESVAAVIGELNAVAQKFGYSEDLDLPDNPPTAALTFPAATWKPEWPDSHTHWNIKSTLRTAYKFLRYNQYPSPFTLACWRHERAAMGWTYVCERGGFVTPHGPSTRDSRYRNWFFPLDNEHMHAVHAYRIIELAHDVRWLATAASNAVPDGVIAPRNTRLAKELLAIRAYQLGIAAGDWRSFSAEDETQRAKTYAFRGLTQHNLARSDATQEWRTKVLRWHQELRAAAPKAPLASIVDVMVERLEDQGTYVSSKAIYMFLYKLERGSRSLRLPNS